MAPQNELEDNLLDFNIFGFAERRFYRKVVQRAERAIQPVLDAAGFPVPQDYAAEFDPNTIHPRLIHRFNNKIDVQVIRFGTRDWEPGKSAEDATNQIANVLVLQFPDQPLTDIFVGAGFQIVPARKCKDQLPQDNYEDAAIFITSDLSVSDFFKLADEIDQIVAQSRLGDVSGTGGGVGGWCIDLTALNVRPCLELVAEELRARKLDFHISNYDV